MLGFLELQRQLGELMGEPLECEHTDPLTGDAYQRTTTGHAHYDSASNTVSFYDQDGQLVLPDVVDERDEMAEARDGGANSGGRAASRPAGQTVRAASAPPAPRPSAPRSSAPAAQPTALPMARPAYCRDGEQPQFVGGFRALEERLGERMGEPLDCEQVDFATGDTYQDTTTGLAFWHKSSNTPTFSIGDEHWAITSDGLISWTGDHPGMPIPDRAPTPVAGPDMRAAIPSAAYVPVPPQNLAVPTAAPLFVEPTPTLRPRPTAVPAPTRAALNASPVGIPAQLGLADGLAGWLVPTLLFVVGITLGRLFGLYRRGG